MTLLQYDIVIKYMLSSLFHLRMPEIKNFFCYRTYFEGSVEGHNIIQLSMCIGWGRE